MNKILKIYSYSRNNYMLLFALFVFFPILTFPFFGLEIFFLFGILIIIYAGYGYYLRRNEHKYCVILYDDGIGFDDNYYPWSSIRHIRLVKEMDAESTRTLLALYLTNGVEKKLSLDNYDTHRDDIFQEIQSVHKKSNFKR